ncbi:MAG: ASKHA domain-containing protein [Clostridiales bacterium]|nr:ASKHA domain-containing protein [Clostridiales bacterium]
MLTPPLCNRKTFCAKTKYNPDACLTCVNANFSASRGARAEVLATGFNVKFDFAPLVRGASLCAVDIGTTTVTGVIFDAQGEQIAKTGFLNPQKKYGLDVIARIEACNKGKLPELQTLLMTEIDKFIAGRDVRHILLSGNPTMEHIAAGVSPYSIGIAPYAPQFTRTRTAAFADCGLTGEGTATLMPNVSGFIGGDIVSGILACGLEKADKTILFLDFGTNGEIVLSKRGELYGCSTAAGPAFEGGNIACGSHAHDKAICNAKTEGGKIVVDRPDGVSIAGGAVIDCAAAFLDLNIIDETGAIDAGAGGANIFELNGEPAVRLNARVYISQRDLREVQLAKSAVKAGVMTLLDAAKIGAAEVDEVYIAGGFGMALNPKSAERISLFPPELRGKTRAVGNTSLTGAIMCVLNADSLRRAQSIADAVRYVELTNNDIFQNFYLTSITFED